MQSLHYTIYKTTNLVNSKIYIGKHVTNDLNDGYLGSGKLLRLAIAKYGVENFQKEILHVFDNEADMNAKERELVTEEFVLQESNYNLCIGGKGGFSYLNINNLSVNTFEDPKIQSRAAKKANDTKRELFESNLDWALAYKAALSKSLVGRSPTFKGRKHTNESLQKIKEAARKRTINSQTGTKWITNGSENQKIKITDTVPDGWVAGRTMSKRRQL